MNKASWVAQTPNQWRFLLGTTCILKVKHLVGLFRRNPSPVPMRLGGLSYRLENPLLEPLGAGIVPDPTQSTAIRPIAR